MIELARLRAFLKLGRPQFLIGGLLLFALGSTLASAQGVGINWQRYVWGQATITAAQWMTHYSNDYFDLDADRANSTPTRWSGGSRVRARFDENCPALDFYGGFYLQYGRDQQICARREAVMSRMGRSCTIERFKLLVPKFRH